MYTRNVSMKLKVNSAKDFTQTLENEVIPVLVAPQTYFISVIAR